MRVVHEGWELRRRLYLTTLDDVLKEQFLTPGGKSPLFIMDKEGGSFTFYPQLKENRSEFLRRVFWMREAECDG